MSEESTMKIYLASDVHLEFYDAPPLTIPDEADVIVLAGDIHVGVAAADYALLLAECHPDAEVIFVAGNHEYYHYNFFALQAHFREMFSRVPNAYFLERNSVVLDGVLFCGCTLWSGFNAYQRYSPEDAMDIAERGISDYRLIGQGERKLKPQDTLQEYEASRAWLKDELKRTDVTHKVVITHFPPCTEVRHENIPVDEISAYFQANCKDLISAYEPDLWIFGHNHYNHDKVICKTRVLSNQRGYPGEMTTFQPYLLIDLTVTGGEGQ
jgi:predicted phosphohydrolase